MTCSDSRTISSCVAPRGFGRSKRRGRALPGVEWRGWAGQLGRFTGRHLDRLQWLGASATATVGRTVWTRIERKPVRRARKKFMTAKCRLMHLVEATGGDVEDEATNAVGVGNERVGPQPQH